MTQLHVTHLGDDEDMLSVFSEYSSHIVDILCLANERGKYNIDILLHTKPQVTLHVGGSNNEYFSESNDPKK